MNEYKKWSNEKIIETGKRLKVLVKDGMAYIRNEPRKTDEEILNHMNWVSAIHKAEFTIETLRNELKQRYATASN